MEIKEERLSLRLSSEEKKFIRKRAIDKDMKISEYIMDLVEREFQNVKHGNNLNIEYGRVESSIAGIIEVIKESKEPANTSIPLIYPAIEELIQELESLKEVLRGKNLID